MNPAYAVVGSVAFFIPSMILNYTLERLGLMNDSLSEVLELAFVPGSAAAGAMIFDAPIRPVLMCAVSGIVVRACFLALREDIASRYSESSPKPSDAKDTDVVQEDKRDTSNSLGMTR